MISGVPQASAQSLMGLALLEAQLQQLKDDKAFLAAHAEDAKNKRKVKQALDDLDNSITDIENTLSYVQAAVATAGTALNVYGAGSQLDTAMSNPQAYLESMEKPKTDLKMSIGQASLSVAMTRLNQGVKEIHEEVETFIKAMGDLAKVDDKTADAVRKLAQDDAKLENQMLTIRAI